MKRFLLAALLAFATAAQAQWPGYINRPASGGGSGGVTIGAAIDGSCTSGYVLYSNAGVIGCLQLTSVTGTPAAGDLAYFDTATSQALLTAASGSAGSYLRGGGTGAAPVWSTLILPNAMTSGGVLYGSSANNVSSSGALTANALMIGGGAGAPPTTTTTGTGILTALGINTGSAGAPVLFNGAGGTPSSLTLTNATGLPIAGGGTGGTSVQTATQALSVPRILYSQGLAMVIPATSTVTAGGAITLGTAFTNSRYPTNAYFYVPALTVASSGAGSTAGWYYTTCSSTTACQIYNNEYTPAADSVPTIPGSPASPTTAGNFTGVTGSQTLATFTVPANAMGANGSLEMPNFWLSTTNNANAKSLSITFGAFTAVNATSLASIAQGMAYFKVNNMGATNKQMSHGLVVTTSIGPEIGGTVDTTGATTVTVTGVKGTATDNLTFWPFMAQVRYAP